MSKGEVKLMAVLTRKIKQVKVYRTGNSQTNIYLYKVMLFSFILPND